MSESIFMCPRNHSECAELCESCQIVELQAQVAALEAERRADVLNFHFWWWNAKGTNSLDGYEHWLTEIKPNYCQCGGPITRSRHCETCEKLVPSIRYDTPPTASDGEVLVSGRIVGGEPIYDEIGVTEPEVD